MYLKMIHNHLNAIFGYKNSGGFCNKSDKKYSKICHLLPLINLIKMHIIMV